MGEQIRWGKKAINRSSRLIRAVMTSSNSIFLLIDHTKRSTPGQRVVHVHCSSADIDTALPFE